VGGNESIGSRGICRELRMNGSNAKHLTVWDNREIKKRRTGAGVNDDGAFWHRDAKKGMFCREGR